MPNISAFTSQKDIKQIIHFFNENNDVGYIVDVGEGSDRKRKWKVFSEIKNLEDGYHQIWHSPSGKIDVEGEKRKDPDWVEIDNPFEGYEAYPYNNNWDIQNTGNLPQFFELEIRTSFNRFDFGLTSIGWIGSRYSKPKDCTKEYWNNLRGFMNKSSKNMEQGIYEKFDLPKFKFFNYASNHICKK